MEICRPNVISILNNDDHPSFTVRPTRTESQENPISFTLRPPCNTDDQDDDNYNGTTTSSSSSSLSPPQPRQPKSRSRGSLSIEPRAYRYDPIADSCVSPVSPGFAQIFEGLAVKPVSSHDSSRPLSSPSQFREKERPVISSATNSTRKSKYPCPYAQSRNCSATFTTSGHAARHGKKHTGEKSVFCPICSKAFTRKDNMNQHYRTHRRPGGGGVRGLKQEPATAAARRIEEETKQQHSSKSSMQYELSPPNTASYHSAPTSDSDEYHHDYSRINNDNISRKRASSYISHRRFPSTSSSVSSTGSTTNSIYYPRTPCTSTSGPNLVSINPMQRDGFYGRHLCHPTSNSHLSHGLDTLANVATGPSLDFARDR